MNSTLEFKKKQNLTFTDAIDTARNRPLDEKKIEIIVLGAVRLAEKKGYTSDLRTKCQHFYKTLKTNISLTALILAQSIVIPNAFAASDYTEETFSPPGSHVKSTALFLEQTDTIFANGRMQAVVRIQHDLATGAKLESIRLKRMYHYDELEPIGWKVSSVDNGFDKIINRNIDNYQYINVHDYSWLYVSADEKNANNSITICAELETSLNNEVKLYDTCRDGGIQNGSVTISAIVPKKYSINDFRLDYSHNLLNNHYEEAYLFKLKKNSSIDSDTTFTVKEGIPYNPNNWMWPYVYNSVLNDRQDNDDISSNVSVYLSQAKEDTRVNYLLSPKESPSIGNFTIPASNEPDVIFNVLNYFLNKEEFLFEDKRCYLGMNGWWNYEPICITPHNLNPQYYYGGADRVIETHSRYITLLDNYGNEAKFTMYIGGRNFHDPYIKE